VEVDVIKAIETRYKGYRFRSRLEARWAVFFDAMGWQWEYEEQGYDLGGGVYYLPDFKVYGEDSNGDYNVFYFEVKAKDSELSESDKDKILKFAHACHDNKLTKGYGDFILLDGPPDKKCFISAGEIASSRDWPYEPLWWAMDIVYRDGRPTFECYFNAIKKDRHLTYLDIEKTFNNTGIYVGVGPIEKARSARFEHGECG
jgi:hypothetical protein